MSRQRPNKITGKFPAVRCAIYTRKSSEEGLEQEFNSLDAQRESGEAYIRSQAGEGWACLHDRSWRKQFRWMWYDQIKWLKELEDGEPAAEEGGGGAGCACWSGALALIRPNRQTSRQPSGWTRSRAPSGSC